MILGRSSRRRDGVPVPRYRKPTVSLIWWRLGVSLVAVTRLRVRSVRFLPSFAVHVFRARRQVREAPGFQGGSLLADRNWTFWTMTVWDTLENMRHYMTTDPHRTTMRYLFDWCDETRNKPKDQPGDDQQEVRRSCLGRSSKPIDLEAGLAV